jgi:coenzyme F420-reducing hydrogenase delta subunit
VNAKRRVKHIKKMLEKIGLEPERIEMFNLSSAMAAEFVQNTGEMVEQIKTLGPNPLRMSTKTIGKESEK